MSDRLDPGQSLAVGGSITSLDGRFTLTLQQDGNLVLYQSGGTARWATGTVGRTVSQAVMQADGNFVLYGPAGPIWATATDGHPGSYIVVQNDGNLVVYGPGGPLWDFSRLNPGQSLAVGGSVPSLDGRFTFTLQQDGNLVLYWTGDPASWPRWATGTDGRTVSQAVMQGDGNFVLYGPGGPIWATATDGHPGSYLAVQNDGNVVIYGPGGALWATGAFSAIDAKYLALGGPRSFLGQPTSLEQDVPPPAPSGRFRDFQGGSVYWRSPNPPPNAFEVHGQIRAKFLALGGPAASLAGPPGIFFLGYPVTDEQQAGDFAVNRMNFFEGAVIFWTPQTGAHEMHGAIYNKWGDMNDSLIPGRGYLGWPTSDVYRSGGSYRQDFQRGYITSPDNQDLSPATSYCQAPGGSGCDHVIGGPANLIGVYWAFNVGTEPQPVTLSLSGTLQSSQGAGGRTSFSGETAQGQLPPGTGQFPGTLGNIPFTVTNLQAGRWRVTVRSDLARAVPITCEISVPALVSDFNATGTGDQCRAP